MSKFKGTKGEWEIKYSESKDAFNIVGTIVGGHYKIARIPYLVTKSLIEVNRREKQEAEANAKLISCAPEMLEMLIKLNNFCTMKIEDRNELEELIKKATCQ